MTASGSRIVILDAFTTNPGDLSWDVLEAIGPLTAHDRTPSGQRLERASEADLLLTNKTLVDAELIAQLPTLRYIGLLSTGTNAVDLDAARERGIPVTNVPAYSTDSVVQMVFAHILRFTQRVGLHDASVRDGGWAAQPDFCYTLAPLIELSGKTLGVIGLGHIGRRVAEVGRAFGMNVIHHSRSDAGLPLEAVFRQCDFLTLHCPLTSDTHHLINATTLGWMKSTAFLVNTGRGDLIDECALADALRAGSVAGAGLDVLQREPPTAAHPLHDLPTCTITPHIAWATRAARERLIGTAAANIRAFLDGTPQNQVN